MIGSSEQYTKGLHLELSVRSPKEQHNANPSNQVSNHSQPHFSTVGRMSGWFFTAPSQQTKIDFEYFNAWIYSVAFSVITNSIATTTSESSPTQSVQLKSGADGFRTETTFPVFRFYNPENRAYLSKSTTSREVVAQERNSFSRQIEWEWIPQPRFNGVYLRNKASKHFFCFNKHGRPTARERLNLRRCLLHGVLRIRDTMKQPKSTNGLSPSGKMQANATTELQLQLQVSDTSENLTNVSNSSYLARMRRSLGRSDDLAKFAVPAAIRLASKLHKPRWHVGFCLNGHAFANHKPYAEKCPSYSLSKRWSLLYICPPVPSQCRIPECKSETRVYDDHDGCPHVCRSSIFCGDISDRVAAVHP
ncbi:hypothetical protein Aperf_G00000034596 [Anoplocephala perfoliata]